MVKYCDVSQYRDDYEFVPNALISHAPTAWKFPITGQTYILILNDYLWTIKTMDHNLIKPNKLCHFVTKVQNNFIYDYPLSCHAPLGISSKHVFMIDYHIMVHLTIILFNTRRKLYLHCNPIEPK